MRTTFQEARTIAAIFIALSMIAPNANAAKLVQLPTPFTGLVDHLAGDIGDPEVILADHRYGYRNDRDWHRPHTDRDRKRRHGKRHGYRKNNDGWWYPLAALALGAIILEQQKQRRTYNQTYRSWEHIPAANMNEHDNWCDERYRSYSRVTKTFQPYNGPRKYCNSPYDLL